MLLGQALNLLSPRRGKYTAGLDKVKAAIDELDRRLASNDEGHLSNSDQEMKIKKNKCRK